MENYKPIFISYSRIDKNIVFPFIKRIENELNTTCWIDSEGIESGSQFEEVIVNAIDESKVVLFMLSDSSINSKWTRREVLYAEDEGKRIVPIVIDGNGLRKWFKFHFGNLDYIDIYEEEQCDKLLNNLASWIGVERKSKETPNSHSDLHPQIKISADKTVITLSILDGLNLTLKKDTERNCFVGEIPVTELLEIFKDKVDDLKVSAKGVCTGIGSTAGAVCGGPVEMLGSLIGTVVGGFFKGNYIEKDNKKEKIFNDTVSRLNQRYGLHLIKRRTFHSDFAVEVDADRVYDLIQPV